MRIAAVGDVHCTKKSEGQLQALFAEASTHADKAPPASSPSSATITPSRRGPLPSIATTW